ncbi:ferredoxin-thioredoxin reductase, variable chain [Vicia villosa]|uniref:ferredoxin-thioredoxin reductase, variable chain n=1 Tax=Vicia villosa TaxID=3911 RepID=UPI00273AB502|nr:ferredoxin-thioredoxin reductase, variable chain [Vicia villosa]
MMSTTSSTTIATMAAPLPFANSKIQRSRRIATMIRCDVDGDSSLKIGARVRVKVPLKVYHVPKVPEVDLSGREGNIKQNVSIWKDKRISANFPYKVEFVAEDIQGPRGPLKFVAHLRDDEFELLE